MTDIKVSRTWLRGAVAIVAAASFAVGCSSSHNSPGSPTAGASATPTSGPAAISLARAAMRTVHSYAFRLSLQQTGAHPANLIASGVVQNPSRLLGSFIVNGRTIRVLSGPNAEWVQLPGKKWQRSPSASVHALPWDTLLGGITNSDVAPGTGAATWRITAHPAPTVARALALSSTPSLVVKNLQVTIDLDDHYRVIKLDAVATGTDNGKPAKIDETVTASGFDAQHPISDTPPTANA